MGKRVIDFNLLEDNDWDDEIHEECGVFGIHNQKEYDVPRLMYYALYALQHRGQESCGIAVNNDGEINGQKGIGLVPEVFSEKILDRMQGYSAIGHTRYSNGEGSSIEHCQPLIFNFKGGRIAIAHNGNLINASKIRYNLENKGAIFQTSSDVEVIANLISRNGLKCNELEEILIKTIDVLEGAYALVILTKDRLFGIRDPWGLRPLCLGKLGNSYVLSSENCAFDTIGADFIRDVEPGEIVIIDDNTVKSIKTNNNKPHKSCIFEHIYFARPDSIIDGASIYKARLEAGRLLAIEHPVEADLVVGVPDSGITAAIGYSRESGIPYGEALIKNRYVGRTFIQPTQKLRERSVDIKLNALSEEIDGKRIIIIDDSIVRGTTSFKIVQMLKNAGAKEVHMRISSPPVLNPCYFGIDFSSKEHLIAANYSIEEIRESIQADSLGFLSVENLLKTPIGTAKENYCTGCFTGNYPMQVPVHEAT